nr:CDP-glycerol glycerophosphotransferase family protein [Lysinibacter cavernae]
MVAARGPLAPKRFVIAVYFADDRVNMYQMRQWYKPLEVLNETWPVLLIARSAGGARALMQETDLDVAFAPKITDIEQVVNTQDLHTVLYVNQNTRNFQMMRYGRMWHVFINHGESDKMYMTTNQFKAYDYSLIAGDAARARLEKALWDYDFDKRAIPIGRPQVDHYAGIAPYPEDGRVTVFYAPTWEGDRATAAYGSIASHGVELAKQLLASDRHRLIYRPHPRSGVVNEAYGQANAQIIQLIEDANKAHPEAQHVFDNSPEIGWQIGQTDVAISDISAMVYDRLAVGKPLFVTRPVSDEAEVDAGGYLSEAEWLLADDAPQIIRRIDTLLADSLAEERLRFWSHRHFGDTTPGAPTARFHAAVEHLMGEWQRWNEHANDMSAR